MATQTQQIVELLRRRGSQGMTAIDALQIVGCFRLAARILDLHAAGYEISSEIETLPNGKRIARYRLVREPYAEPTQAQQTSWL